MVPVTLIDSDSHAIQNNATNRSSARLGSIPGQIFGSPHPPFVYVDLGRDLTLQINIKRLREIGEQATTISAQGTELGWNIVPADTRFSRVSTNFESRGTQARETGIVDAVSGNTLLLVFFDRPCRLTGTIHPGSGANFAEYVFDIVVSSAGFNWIAIEKNGAGDSAVVRSASAQVRPMYRAR